MLPHRLILFHRAQEATGKTNPKPSSKPRGRLMSHRARKPKRTPHLKPPWRQLKAWNPPKIPQNQHRRLPLHPTTGRQQQLSYLTTNPQPFQTLPLKFKRTLNPPTNNHLSYTNRYHRSNHPRNNNSLHSFSSSHSKPGCKHIKTK